MNVSINNANLNNAGQVIDNQTNGDSVNSRVVQPIDIIIQSATKASKSQNVISLKSLKKIEVDKIMLAFAKCKKAADDYYTSTIRPKLQERNKAYIASEKYYQNRFPAMSEMSRFCSRDIKTTIDWMLPSLCEPFIGGDDPVDIKGVNVNDDENANKLQLLLKYQLQNKNNYPTFISNIWVDALKLNYAVAKIYWNRNEKRDRYKLMVSNDDMQTIAVLNQEVATGNIEIVKQEAVKDAQDLSVITFEKVTVSENYPVIEYMSPSEFRFTPDGKSIYESKFKAHRKIVSGDYLKRKEKDGIYQNIDKAMSDFSGNCDYDLFDTQKNTALNTIGNQIKDDDNASQNFELYEAYLQVDYNNDGIYENIIVHAIGNTPISICNNDFKDLAPFFVANAEKNPVAIFNENESFADNLLQQQDLKTAIFRQIIVNVAKNNTPRMFVNNDVDFDALIENDEFVLVSSNKNPRESFAEGAQLSISPLTMNILEYAQNEIEAQSGSTRYNQGLDSNSLNKTATGLTAIMGSAEKRLKHMARMFAENFIIPMMKYLILLNQQYLQPEQIIRLADENIIINKDELDIDYDLIINVGSGAGTKEAQIQYLMLLINQIYPQLANLGIVNQSSWYELVKDLLEKMGIRNVSNYLLDPNSDVAKQQAQMQQQQAQQAEQKTLEIEKMKKEFEIEKARQPNISIRYEDLPPVAKMQLLEYFGLKLNAQDIVQKEQMDYEKKKQY